MSQFGTLRTVTTLTLAAGAMLAQTVTADAQGGYRDGRRWVTPRPYTSHVQPDLAAQERLRLQRQRAEIARQQQELARQRALLDQQRRRQPHRSQPYYGVDPYYSNQGTRVIIVPVPVAPDLGVLGGVSGGINAQAFQSCMGSAAWRIAGSNVTDIYGWTVNATTGAASFNGMPQEIRPQDRAMYDRVMRCAATAQQ